MTRSVTGAVSTCVVVAAGGYSYLVIAELGDEPVLIGDASRPVAVKPVLEGSGLPIPSLPFRSTSLISVLIRLRTLRSWVCHHT